MIYYKLKSYIVKSDPYKAVKSWIESNIKVSIEG